MLTPGERWAANRDDALLARLPGELEIVRTPSFERPPALPAPESVPEAAAPVLRLARVRRLKGQVAHALRFPDAEVGWAPYAITAGLRAIRRRRPDALYSTAAPFTNHLVALVLWRLTRLPWVVELRDGWYLWNRSIFPDYPHWRDPLERALEGAVMRSASRVVLATAAMAARFRGQYGDLPAAHFQTVSNGFDPALFEDVPPYAPVAGRFRVVHAGSLYYGRSAGAFLEAAADLARENQAFAEQFELRLVGNLDSGSRAELQRLVHQHELTSRVYFNGAVPHREALVFQRQADLLLLAVNTTPGAEATVPAKLFEYMAAARPVLAVVPPEAEAADVVEGTGVGRVARAGNVASIKEVLRAAFDDHLQGRPFAPNAAAVAQFDRSQLARKLAGILDEVAAAR